MQGLYVIYKNLAFIWLVQYVICRNSDIKYSPVGYSFFSVVVRLLIFFFVLLSKNMTLRYWFVVYVKLIIALLCLLYILVIL